MTFRVFEHGFNPASLVWLAAVLAVTGLAALRGMLPGAEPRPYILRFDEDRPNPLYRRVCYTFAWNTLLNFTLLHFSGLLVAVIGGVWYLKQIYDYAYLPLCGVFLLLGAAGKLPRVGPSTRGEGTERRYFYGTVWAVGTAHALLGVLWKIMTPSPTANVVKLCVFSAALLLMGLGAYRGALPRTRPILAGELMISD